MVGVLLLYGIFTKQSPLFYPWLLFYALEISGNISVAVTFSVNAGTKPGIYTAQHLPTPPQVLLGSRL